MTDLLFKNKEKINADSTTYETKPHKLKKNTKHILTRF